MKKLMSKKKGFTLVELLVVIAIIAILMLIALPKFMDSTKGATIRTFESNARTLISAANTSMLNNANSNANVDNDIKDLVASIHTNGTANTGKPKGATYVYTSNVLTCTLPKDSYGGTADYVIKFDTSTGAITQEPTTLPSGATKF